jgi:hypothetical protein
MNMKKVVESYKFASIVLKHNIYFDITDLDLFSQLINRKKKKTPINILNYMENYILFSSQMHVLLIKIY